MGAFLTDRQTDTQTKNITPYNKVVSDKKRQQRI